MKPWTSLRRQIVFEKYSRRVERVDFQLPDGREADFYIKNEGVALCVLALTPDQKVILVKQYRPGPDEILLELPGGAMEEGESPLQAMKRELLEESGYQGKLELATCAYDCAYSTRIRYCFVARDCVKVSEPQPDANEFLEVVLVSLQTFRAHLRSGKLTDIDVGYLGLDHLRLL